MRTLKYIKKTILVKNFAKKITKYNALKFILVEKNLVKDFKNLIIYKRDIFVGIVQNKYTTATHKILRLI